MKSIFLFLIIALASVESFSQKRDKPDSTIYDLPSDYVQFEARQRELKAESDKVETARIYYLNGYAQGKGIESDSLVLLPLNKLVAYKTKGKKSKKP